MASNNGRPLPQRKNGANKKIKELKSKVMQQLKELFGSTFETSIIMSVAENCNWQLENSIETLINLSASAAPQKNKETPVYDPWAEEPNRPSPTRNHDYQEDDPVNILKMNQNELQQQLEEFRKFEQNRDTTVTPKIETESLCGLKVQYRPKGMENNHSDDDADVVIEEEPSDYRIETPEPEKINVCQFLSAPTQSAPKNTFPKVNFISTPSPPRTPLKVPTKTCLNDYLPPALNRIEADIKKGFKVMILMRGLPGSGKSYLSKLIVSRTVTGSDFSKHIFSTDEYFKVMNRGVYVFNPAQLSDAHDWNENRVLNAMRSGWSPVIVDNTNTQAWEMQKYACYAVQHGYIIETLESVTPWCQNIRELERRNEHRVSKATIRAMLERYEPNLTGDRLLRMFKLSYMPRNQPPQMRSLPRLITPEDEIERKLENITIKQRRVRKPKNTNELMQAQQNVDSQRLVDNNALKSIAKEYANIDCGPNVSPNIDIKQTNESWTAGSSYKEDNLLDFSKLGAIGCERKVSNIFKDEEENKFSDDQQLVNVNNSISKAEKDDKISSIISQCWDFTLIKDGIEIHSKFAEETNNNSPDKHDIKNIFVNNGQTTYIKSYNNEHKESLEEPSASVDNVGSRLTTEENILDLPTVNTDEGFEAEKTSKASTPVSENAPSSHSSSIERISEGELSQLDHCSSDNIQLLDSEQANRGLSSFFSYIKNSFLGNEKDNCIPFENLSDNESNISTTDRLTDKLRSNTKKSGNSSPVLSISLAHSLSADTLSKHLGSSNEVDTENNLGLKIQEIIEFPSNSSFEQEEEEEENEQFFVDQVLENTEVEYNIDENIIRELLDASSDFQLVEDYCFNENVIKNKEEKIYNDFEKSLIEGIKNLQVTTNREEDESKVSKEPIDKAFGSKNTFPEKIQNAIGDLDNINLMNWREPSFPIPNNAIIESDNQIAERPETRDCETFTDSYDFNVAFIGGTDEYKVLNTSSRDINEHNKQPQISPITQRSGKLQLHKGTMTNVASILFKDEYFESQDRSDDLVKRFSHLPQACVLDVYENLCHRDYDWTLDYLSTFQEDDATILAAFDQIEEGGSKLGLSIKTETSSRSESPSGPFRQHPSTRSKRDRFKKTPDNFALQQELESKIEINRESYKPHTLRVKRWKNRDFSPPINEDLMKFDELIDLSSANIINETITAPTLTPKIPKKSTTMETPMTPVDQASSSDDSESNADEDEIMELNLGHDFIKVLESEFGNPYFETPLNLSPVIEIKKSMAQELYALWIESIQRQVWDIQEKLDDMIAKDAEYARSLEREEEQEARGLQEPEVPNLKEIMDMEMALAVYRNDVNQKIKKESFKDLSFRVAQQILHELFPDYDRQMMYEIYEAHDRNIDETLKIIKENCENKSTLTMADVIKKRKKLIDELHKESSYQTSKHDQFKTQESYDEACGYDYDYGFEEEILTPDDAMKAAHNYRKEARRQLELRNENNQKAAESYRKRNPDVAAYYSDVAKLHIKKMEMANSAAASAILAAQAHIIESDDKIDLHFLKVAEASQALDIFLDNQLEKLSGGARKYVYIITGRGSRSANGLSKIKPLVARKLNNRNIRFSEANPGMLKAFLRKK